MISALRTTIGATPSATAPMASSGCAGTPIFRTRIRSSGAPSAAATSAATGTPPRGSAKTMGWRSTYPASAAARQRPAADRFSKDIAPLPLPRCPLAAIPFDMRGYSLRKNSTGDPAGAFGQRPQPQGVELDEPRSVAMVIGDCAFLEGHEILIVERRRARTA